MSLSLQEAREEGVLSNMEQLFAIIAQGVGAQFQENTVFTK